MLEWKEVQWMMRLQNIRCIRFYRILYSAALVCGRFSMGTGNSPMSRKHSSWFKKKNNILEKLTKMNIDSHQVGEGKNTRRFTGNVLRKFEKFTGKSLRKHSDTIARTSVRVSEAQLGQWRIQTCGRLVRLLLHGLSTGLIGSSLQNSMW